MFAASGMVILLQTAGVQVMPPVYTGGFARDDRDELFFAECLQYGISSIFVMVYAGDGSFKSLPMLTAYTFLALIQLGIITHGFGFEDVLFERLSWKLLLGPPGEVVFDGDLYFLVGTLLSLGIFAGLVAAFHYKPSLDHFTDPSGAPLPTDVPCPMMWKDPLADLLWAF